MWIATDEGLAQWLAGQRNFESHKNDPLDSHSLLDTRVHSLFQDSGDVLWVGTYGGVSRWNYVSDAFQNYHSGTNHLTKDIVTVVAENNSGELWIGTYGGGINRLIPATNSTDFYQFAPVPVIDLADQRIMALAVDEQDIVWIGLALGLMLGLGLALIRAFVDQTFHSRGELAAVIPLPVLIEIPRIEAAPPKDRRGRDAHG